jgi:Ca2+-binding EF-hand superfamily protein
MKMRKSTKLAVAFLAFAGAASSVAYAQNDRGPRGDRGGDRFERLDADSSGDISFEEFAAALNGRMGLADADNDGKLSVEEIALELERMRYRRMAQRMIERFDTDGDGALTTAEVESHQKKMFALMDRNDDGKVEQGEMRRRDMRRHRR